jgi:heat shock protein HtpX
MTHYQLVNSNKTRSWVIMASFVTFITGAVYIMSKGLGYGLDMVGIALIISGFTSIGSYYFSDKIILMMSNAHPATRDKHFDFYTIAENLAASQRLPKPKLYVIEDTALNAFATGRDPKHAVICCTTGLLATLNRSELEAVIAHELGHVKNYDILLMSIVAVLVGFIALLSDWMLRMTFWGRSGKNDSKNNDQLQMVFFAVGLLLAALTPIIAQLIKLAISRRREYLADATSAAITKNPQGLINALKKISADREPLEAANKATAHLYISDPLKNNKTAISWFANLFQTHPPVGERIAALQKIS